MKPSSSATNPIPGDRNTDPAELLRTLQSPYWVPVSGSSMQPLLRNGDFVLIEPWTKKMRIHSLQPGTVILFVREGQLIVHRFLRRERGMLLERGDRQKVSHPLQLEELLGVAVSRKRDGVIHPLTLPFRWRVRNLFERDHRNV